MYDHSYNYWTIARLLRKGDFRTVSLPLRDTFREVTITNAVQSAISSFNGTNPIVKFHLKKKAAYRIKKVEDDLVIRKLSENIQQVLKNRCGSRAAIVSNLRHFLEEGVPYRIYRLDVRSFYESFSADHILEKMNVQQKISPLSKRHLRVLLEYYHSIGGVGLPRGMAISAVLSDMMMESFDSIIFSNPVVYFYGRYVDDIVILTNTSENKSNFICNIEETLPRGLFLNEKKTSVAEHLSRPSKVKPPDTQPLQILSTDYLGYRFSVFNPVVSNNSVREGYRQVVVDIAPNKVKKIKLRIIRALLDFDKTKDSGLLTDRIKYLTSNFSVVDKNTGKRKQAGIYYSYPHLSHDSTSLDKLDQFLRNSLLSKKGRVFSKTFTSISGSLRRTLLAQSFKKGFSDKRFVHFSSSRIHSIQQCWINE